MTSRSTHNKLIDQNTKLRRHAVNMQLTIAGLYFLIGGTIDLAQNVRNICIYIVAKDAFKERYVCTCVYDKEIIHFNFIIDYHPTLNKSFIQKISHYICQQHFS